MEENIMPQVLKAYDEKKNIMKALRGNSDTNSATAIQISYDLQTGSYIDNMKDQQHKELSNNNSTLIASYINRYLPDGGSLLDAGVGECTTFVNVNERLKAKNIHNLAFDISWSRLHYGRAYLQKYNIDATLFMAGLEEIPLKDNSIDVVYTCHSVEPNRGREEQILKELFRVTKKALILFEPSYELSSEEQRIRMDEHKYCRGLKDIVLKEGWDLKEHRIVFDGINSTAVTLIEKNSPHTSNHCYVCPICRNELLATKDHLFCNVDGVVFPILDKIPCLLSSVGIIASKFTDEVAL